MAAVPGLRFLGFDEAGPQLRGCDLHVDAVNPASDHQRRDDVGGEIGRGADFRHEAIDAEQQRDAGDGHRIHHWERGRQRDEAAAGVTGGGFIALAATLPVVDAVPVAGLALLLGVDRFMAEIRAATNLTSNIIATLVVGRWVNGIDMEVATAELRAGFVETEETPASNAGEN